MVCQGALRAVAAQKVSQKLSTVCDHQVFLLCSVSCKGGCTASRSLAAELLFIKLEEPNLAGLLYSAQHQGHLGLAI